MTQKLLMYGIGRETKYNDMPVVRAIMRGAEPNRYNFPIWFWAWFEAPRSRCESKRIRRIPVASARRPQQ